MRTGVQPLNLEVLMKVKILIFTSVTRNSTYHTDKPEADGSLILPPLH